MVEIQAINKSGTGKKDKLKMHFKYRIVFKKNDQLPKKK